MHVGHDPIVIAHPRYAGVLDGAGIESAELANGVVIADLEPSRLAAVFLILRDLAERDELEDVVAAPDARMPGYYGMRTYDGAGPNLYMLADYGVGADLDIGREAGPRMHDRAWVNHTRRIILP
jgi:hypothetical protein